MIWRSGSLPLCLWQISFVGVFVWTLAPFVCLVCCFSDETQIWPGDLRVVSLWLVFSVMSWFALHCATNCVHVVTFLRTTYSRVRTEPQSDIGQTEGKKETNRIWWDQLGSCHHVRQAWLDRTSVPLLLPSSRCMTGSWSMALRNCRSSGQRWYRTSIAARVFCVSSHGQLCRLQKAALACAKLWPPCRFLFGCQFADASAAWSMARLLVGQISSRRGMMRSRCFALVLCVGCLFVCVLCFGSCVAVFVCLVLLLLWDCDCCGLCTGPLPVHFCAPPLAGLCAVSISFLCSLQPATERVERPGESQEALDRKKNDAQPVRHLPYDIGLLQVARAQAARAVSILTRALVSPAWFNEMKGAQVVDFVHIHMLIFHIWFGHVLCGLLGRQYLIVFLPSFWQGDYEVLTHLGKVRTRM